MLAMLGIGGSRTDFKVDGGISSCYVTPEGEQALAAPSNLAPKA